MELRKYNKINNSDKSNADEVITELDKIKSKVEPVSENIHKDHRSRLKTQFLVNGISALTDIQKLELLLFYSIPQKDTNPLAHALIKEFGSIKNVLKADFNQLTKVNGIKENTATFITFVNDILNYCNMPDEHEHIGGVKDAIAHAKQCFYNVDVEQFYIFCLSKGNNIIKRVLVKTGTADEVSVQIRNLTQIAIETKCNKIIIAHNHPAGKAEMSDEDCAFTYSLICSCVLNSIDVVDHIIVGTDKAISLGARGIIQKLKSKAINTIQLPKDKRDFLSASSKDYIIEPED